METIKEMVARHERERRELREDCKHRPVARQMVQYKNLTDIDSIHCEDCNEYIKIGEMMRRGY